MNLTSIPTGLASLAMFQADKGGSFWMPQRSSTIASGIDFTFYFIYWISVFFFVLIVALMLVFIIKYRSRDGQKRKKAPHHSMVLEVVWTVIPLILVIAIFWYTFKAYMGMGTAPAGAYEITVIGQKWSWMFQYPSGPPRTELYIPVDTPIKLNMRSEDVIHSFYIPAFRVKKDVVPGRYTDLWFEATEEGDYTAFCTEYCGTGHSDMLANVKVLSKDLFLAWVNKPPALEENQTPAQAGEQLFSRYGCIQCHSVDGVAGTGPTMLDAYNVEHDMLGGESVLMDNNHIRESLIDPKAKVRQGFQPVMPTFKGKLTDNQIDWIIAYLKTLSQYSPQSELDEATSVPQPESEAETGEPEEGAGVEQEQQPDAEATDAESSDAGTAEGNQL